MLLYAIDMWYVIYFDCMIANTIELKSDIIIRIK